MNTLKEKLKFFENIANFINCFTFLVSYDTKRSVFEINVKKLQRHIAINIKVSFFSVKTKFSIN